MTPLGMVLRLNEVTEATLTNSVIATKTLTNLTHCRYEVYSEGKQECVADMRIRKDAKGGWCNIDQWTQMIIQN